MILIPDITMKMGAVFLFLSLYFMMMRASSTIVDVDTDTDVNVDVDVDEQEGITIITKESYNDNNNNNNNHCSDKIRNDGLSQKEIKRSAIASRLTELLYNLDGGSSDSKDNNKDNNKKGDNGNNRLFSESYGFYNGTYYESGIDAAYTLRHQTYIDDNSDAIDDEYCFVIFRGTTRTSMKDWFSNADTDPVEYLDQCDIHQGYYDAYNFEYRSLIESFVTTCSHECSGCDIVLSGHSQGGSIAEIAGLYLQDQLQPQNHTDHTNDDNDNESSSSLYVITFGSPQALGKGCMQLLSSVTTHCNWYHYIMTTTGVLGREIVYDPVPMMYSHYFDKLNDTFVIANTYARYGGLAYIGHEIVLGGSYDTTRTYYSGFNTHGIRDYTKIDTTGRAHAYELYTTVLESQYQDSRSNYNNNNDNNNHNNNYIDVDEKDDKTNNIDETSSSSSSSSSLASYMSAYMSSYMPSSLSSSSSASLSSSSSSSSSSYHNYYLPTTGFAIGSLCNVDENMCLRGSDCKKSKVFGWSAVCQPLRSSSSNTGIVSSTTALSSRMDTTTKSKNDNSNRFSTSSTSSSSSSSSKSSNEKSSWIRVTTHTAVCSLFIIRYLL